MTTRHLSIAVVHASVSELSAAQQSLCAAAQRATALSYSPYSRFRVGCAAKLVGVDEFVPAANLENAAYPQCICAEAALLARVHAQYPGVAIEAVAIAVEGAAAKTEGAGPCGSCRQQLFEAELRQGNRPIKLYLVGGGGDVRIIGRCSDLLPLGFTLKDAVDLPAGPNTEYRSTVL